MMHVWSAVKALSLESRIKLSNLLRYYDDIGITIFPGDVVELDLKLYAAVKRMRSSLGCRQIRGMKKALMYLSWDA